VTTIDDVIIPVDAPVSVTRRRVWPRVLVGFLLGLVLGLALAIGALVAWDAGYEGRVLSGVDVGGVDVSGMTRDEAVAALGAAFGGSRDGRVVVDTAVGAVSVAYHATARPADIEAMADAALQAGRTGTPAERAVAQVRLALSRTSIEPRVTFHDDALAASITTALARLDRPAIDSRVTVDADGVHATPAVPGRTFDAVTVAAAATSVVSGADAPPTVQVEAPMTVVEPAHGGQEALDTQAAIKRMTSKVVVTLGKKKWTIKAKTVRGWIDIQVAADGSSRPVVDQAAVAKALKKVGKAVKRAPVSAKYLKTRGGRIVGVVAATDGRKIDTTATAAAIAAAIEERASGTKVEKVKVKTIALAPKLATAVALKKGPQMFKLGSWKTWFPISDRNHFGANIWLPAKFIDGKVLMPGQRFEWWSAIGPVTSGRGFGMGGFIAGDHTDPTGAMGGGMCSSSTTLFNAALRAGLQMGARSNHKYYIYRYPLGLDATVSKTRGGGGQTMSFTNDMKHPIVIRSFRYRSGGRGWVRYEIWGIPDGRKVSLSKPSVSNVRKAVTRTEYVSTLRKGRREQIEFPANGMDVAVTRTVRSSGGRVLHRDTYRTHYVLWNGLIQIGR